MHNSNTSSNVYLNCEQIDALKQILDRPIPIFSSPPSNLPTLNLIPRCFLRQILSKLKEHSIDITSIRLNGGAASFVLVNDAKFPYRDIDILITIRTPLSSEQKTTLFSSNNETYSCDVWTIIKYVVCSCLLEHIANATSSNDQPPQQYTHHYLSTVLDAYAKKNIKISSDDSWALLSLQNYAGQNLELKFVEHLKRQWQFSVDSLQINLEPLLFEKQPTHHSNRHASHLYKCPSISSITKTIKTNNLIIDAINGLTIIKREHDDAQQHTESKGTTDKTHTAVSSTSPIQFGFFTPSSSPPDAIHRENQINCQTLATITTVATSNSNHPTIECRSRQTKSSISTIHEEPTNASLQFHLSINDDIDDGIVSDADDPANEDDDDDQVFRTPVNANSAPSSPATIIVVETPSSPLQIEVFSFYKDLNQALEHLRKKLIATYAPESMRGGGLLKYCDLLAQNYKVHDVTDMFRMQRYMCSRFFIDYKTVPEQMHVITQYVSTHFIPLSISNIVQSPTSLLQHRTNQANCKSSHVQNNDQNNVTNARLCLLFFDHLSHVIQQSTVCLTHHDKEATLININNLKGFYHSKYEPLFNDHHHHQQQQRYHSYSHQHHNHYHNLHCSSSSSNSSRSSSPSSSSSHSHRYYGHHNYRHQNSHYRHHNLARQSPNSSSYHHGCRNYSNDFHSNQQVLTNHYQRRHHS